MRVFFAVLCAVFVLLFLSWSGTRIVEAIQFSRGTSGYLKRAADANSIDLAIENLTMAITKAQADGLTSGYTSILYTSPSEDIGFWFKNLTTSLATLKAEKPDASVLEQTNILIKLRETLLDHTQSGEEVTIPSGISVFPNNTLFCIWGWLSGILAIVFGGLFVKEY